MPGHSKVSHNQTAKLDIPFETSSVSGKTTQTASAFKDIFGPGSNPQKRYLSGYADAQKYSVLLKGLDLSVVYTPGVWDLPHIGHGRYWERAKEHGDILIVGVELDDCVKIRKGPNRPIVPFSERVEMLCHIRHIDLVVPILDFNHQGKCGVKMVEAISPDIMIMSQRSFKDYDDTEQFVRLVKKYVKRVEIMESQAETSTSNKIRDLVLGYGTMLKQNIHETREIVTRALDHAWEDIETKIDSLSDKM